MRLRPSALLVTFLLFSSFAFMLGVPQIPKAHAAVTVVQAARFSGAGATVGQNVCTGASSCAMIFDAAVTVGDEVIIVSMFRFVAPSVTESVTWPGSTGAQATGTVCAIMDSQGASSCAFEDIFYVKEQSSGKTTYTLTTSATADIYAEAIEVSGLNNQLQDAKTGTCGGLTCTTSATTSASTNFASGGILVGGIGQYTSTFSGAASGWSEQAGVVTTCQSAASAGRNCLEWQITSSDSSANYPNTAGTMDGWVDAGAYFGPAQATVISVAPCTFFQLQCWWYPTLFFGLYMAPFMGIASGGKVSQKGTTYLILSSLITGAFIEVILGIMNIVLPLLMITLWILYTFRFAIRGAAERGVSSVRGRIPVKAIKGWLLKGAIWGITGLAFISALFGKQVVYATVTSTITGWLVPDATHLNNGFFALLYPLIGVALISGMALAIGRRGDFIVTTTLLGQLVGSVLAMLSVTSSGTSAIPFAMLLPPAFSLVVWLWEGGSE